jgi:iron complex outermembrane recepter protein
MQNHRRRPSTPRRCAGRVSVVLAWIVLAAFAAGPSRADDNQADLANESLENLMNIQVTSVSRTEQKLSQTAAAVFVITQEDIARSGATNIPDLLRMVPGMDVAQINANAWAISVRGFDQRFSNQLLVLVDGRSVYTSSFGGVYWDVLDVPLQDIDRIEVIRGPGASVWGANAVNGVVNIITKKASETQGATVVAGGGALGTGFGELQYGGGLGTKTDYRLFTKYQTEGSLPGLTGADGGDGWHTLRMGFRSDTSVSSKDTLMLQGDLYSGREGNPTYQVPNILSAPIPAELTVNLSGGYLQGLWKHEYSSRSGTSLEVSYDHYARNDVVHDHRGTLDVEFQHHFEWGTRQNLQWGLEYRRSSSESKGSLLAAFNPEDLVTQLFGSYVQDEIAVVPNRLSVTVGTKFEHNYYTGFGVMPSARAALAVTTRQTLWAAFSRAVRTPSALDASFRANFGALPGTNPPEVFSFVGNPNVQNEDLNAYEFGYRTQATSRLSLDIASYYNDYDNQESTELGTPFFENSPAPPHLVLPFTYENLLYGESHGMEMFADWQPTHRWTLSPGYTLERIHMHLSPGSTDTTSIASRQGSSPEQSAQLRSHFSVWRGLSWDASAYFVDRLKDPIEPAYTRVDTQLAWHFGEATSIAVVGQNLAQDHHQEFSDYTLSAQTTEVKRGVYAKFAARF